jgi:hypothetical protein
MAKDRSGDKRRAPKIVWQKDAVTKSELLANNDESQSKMYGKYAEGLDDYRAAQAEHEKGSRGL